MRKLSCIIQEGPKHDQMLPYKRGRGNGDRDPGTGNMTKAEIGGVALPASRKGKEVILP